VDPLVASITVPLTYYTTWYNAVVGGKTYTGQNSVVETFAITTSTFVYEQYVFPSLIVTSLTPGQLIVMSWTQLPPITGVSTGYYNLEVPTYAITLASSTSTTTDVTPTATPSPSVGPTTVTPTPTPTPASSSGSSTNVGAIAGGAIGGVVFLGAIAVFAWYKTRTHGRARDSVLPPVEYNPGYNPGPGAGGAAAMGGAGYYEKRESQGYGQNNQRDSAVIPQSPTLRYPDPDVNQRDEVPSGNVGRGNY